jgi:mRNA interferase HigB
VNVINRVALREMMVRHPDAQVSLEAWWRVAKAGNWNHLAACRAAIPSADQVGRCLIFNIQGNSFRLITVVSWRNRRIYVKALLTHRESERNIWHNWAF